MQFGGNTVWQRFAAHLVNVMLEVSFGMSNNLTLSGDGGSSGDGGGDGDVGDCGG